jgi:hypothetical protein
MDNDILDTVSVEQHEKLFSIATIFTQIRTKHGHAVLLKETDIDNDWIWENLIYRKAVKHLDDLGIKYDMFVVANEYLDRLDANGDIEFYGYDIAVGTSVEGMKRFKMFGGEARH